MICASCETNETRPGELMCETCESICDHCGGSAYPIKGGEPSTPGGWAFVKKHSCYHPDKNTPAMGTYSCPYCGRGNPEGNKDWLWKRLKQKPDIAKYIPWTMMPGVPNPFYEPNELTPEEAVLVCG